ncbi:hypothetical protein [Nocardioides marmotae]|uniref:hypothetical protein n=1 Tax=Nocardioides marmotae TaxID=2663857 RepID=UPI001CA9F644|nr:hypothetical protein [Nocardioides marmotae]
MTRRLSLLALPGVLLTASALTAPVHAAAEPNTAPVIAKVTTENTGGGLSPYAHLYTSVVVSFTDETPSKEEAYRIQVPGVGTADVQAWPDPADPTRFQAYLAGSTFTDGTSYDITVRESPKGQDAVTSAARPFTFSYVGHPASWKTSSKKIKGQWSYRAGRAARISFKGAWEAGTRITTQVWVSKGKKFTPDDWTHNLKNALVQKTGSQAVLSFKVPNKLRGKYLWVSVRGWKNGKAGWVFEAPPAKVVR